MKYTDLNKTKYQSLHLFNDNIKLKNSINKSANELLNENFNIPMLHKLLKDKKYSALRKISSEFNKIYNQYSQNKIGYITDFNKYISSLRKQIKETNIPQINEQKIIKKVITKFNEITSDIPTYNNLLENIINESYDEISNNFYATKSVYDVERFLKSLNASKPTLRLLYDKSVKLWLADFGDTLIHFNMLRAAYKAGFYPQFRNQYEFENYINEDEWLDEPNMYRFKAYYNSENIKELINQEKADGYNTAYQYDTFTIIARSDVDLPETPLFKKLGKPNDTILLNENKILTENETNLNDNFWKWFRDSKVKNIEGKPLVMYHRTNSDLFDIFDIKKSHPQNLYGQGFYFSGIDMPSYGKNVLKCYLSIQNPFEAHKIKYNKKLFSKYFSKKELDIIFENETELYGSAILLSILDNQDKKLINSINIRDMLIDMGYDGIHKLYYWVAFEPNQIKSINDNGEWNPNSNNIMENINEEKIIAYHGSKSSFNNFDVNKQKTNKFGKGFYFTNDKNEAKEYGDNIIKVNLTMNNPLYLKDAYFANDELLNNIGIKKFDHLDSQDSQNKIKAAGYDSIIVNNVDGKKDLKYYIVFEPKQIEIVKNNLKENITLPIYRTGKQFSIIGYHGTPNDFDNFDIKYSKDGIYFAPKNRLYSLASYYAKENGYIIKAKITLNNPFVGSPKEFQELYNKHYNEMKEKYDGVISVSDGSFPFNSKYFNYKTHKNEEEILNKGDIVEIVVFNPEQIQIISKQKLNSEQLEEEKIKLPKLEIGDKIKIGKYRNKKATIKDYFIDKDGQPNIKTNKGDRKLFSFKLEESKININPKNKKFIKI